MATPGGSGAVTEPDDSGCEPIATDLVVLHEVLEWEAAIRAEAAQPPPDEEAPQ